MYQGCLALQANKLALIGLGILALLVLMACFAPWVATHDPLAQDLAGPIASTRISPLVWTDELGRDIFSRVVYGARITLYIVALVVLIAPLGGLLIGTMAGYCGGWLDALLMRVTDIFLAFPRLILALAFYSGFGGGD